MHSTPRAHRHRSVQRAHCKGPAARLLVTVMRPILSCLGHLPLRAKHAGARIERGSPISQERSTKGPRHPKPRFLPLMVAVGALMSLLAFGDCGRSSPLQCTSNKDCPNTQICTPNQRCTPKVAECATDRECGIHYRCEHFDCIALNACKSDFDCAPPDRCQRDDPKDTHGNCEPMRQCPQACPALHFCGADLRCIPNGACGSDRDCKGDTQCDHGHCRALLCQSDRDCKSPRRCEAVKDAKVCRLPTRCRYDQDCSVSQECQDKVCTTKASDCQDCEAPSTCVQGRCLSPSTDSGTSPKERTQ